MPTGKLLARKHTALHLHGKNNWRRTLSWGHERCCGACQWSENEWNPVGGADGGRHQTSVLGSVTLSGWCEHCCGWTQQSCFPSCWSGSQQVQVGPAGQQRPAGSWLGLNEHQHQSWPLAPHPCPDSLLQAEEELDPSLLGSAGRKSLHLLYALLMHEN